MADTDDAHEFEPMPGGGECMYRLADGDTCFQYADGERHVRPPSDFARGQVSGINAVIEMIDASLRGESPHPEMFASPEVRLALEAIRTGCNLAANILEMR